MLRGNKCHKFLTVRRMNSVRTQTLQREPPLTYVLPHDERPQVSSHPPQKLSFNLLSEVRLTPTFVLLTGFN